MVGESYDCGVGAFVCRIWKLRDSSQGWKMILPKEVARFGKSRLTKARHLKVGRHGRGVLACAESSAILGIHFCVTPRSLLYGEFENSIPSPSQLPKIEAIQTSLFVDVLNAFSAMIDSLSAAIRFRILRLLLLH